MLRFKLQCLIERGFVTLIVILLLCASWLQGHSPDYVSAGSPRIASGAIEQVEHREHRAETAPALAVGSFALTAAFAYSFVKFDRKQNTRLWPFVTTGTTRSPPFFL
jgi:hypothetical protein